MAAPRGAEHGGRLARRTRLSWGRVLCGSALSEPCQNRFDDVIERDRHERGDERQSADRGQRQISCHDVVHLRGRSPGVSLTAQGLQRFHLVSPHCPTARAHEPRYNDGLGGFCASRAGTADRRAALIQPGDGRASGRPSSRSPRPVVPTKAAGGFPWTDCAPSLRARPIIS